MFLTSTQVLNKVILVPLTGFKSSVEGVGSILKKFFKLKDIAVMI